MAIGCMGGLGAVPGGLIRTTCDGSEGILAQSIVGGGIILNEGTGAHGLVLQPIGGGGGAVFGNINGRVTLSSTNTGNGGDITLKQDQLIVARGANAVGVIAQSLDRCVWGVGSTTAFDQEETGEYWGATSRIFNARVGMEQRLNADWALSLAAGYNSLQRQQTARMNTQGDGFDVGAGLIRQGAKGTDLRLIATGGWQWLESQRYGYVFDTMVGHSKGQNGYLQLGAELGHTVRAGEFFLRPAVGVMGTALINGDYAERGWDGLGARVEGDTQYIGAIEPKVTTGWTFDPAQGVNAALSLTAGRVHRSEDGISLPIRLMGASTASDAADITTPLDRAAWKLGFEAKIRTDSGVTFQAGYDGQLGDKADVHTGSVSVRWSF